MKRTFSLPFALVLLCAEAPADSKTNQLYDGVARPPSEVVTVTLGGPFWGIRGGIAGAKILVNGKGVGLKNASEVLPGTYSVGITTLCGRGETNPPPQDAIFGFAVFSTSFTAEAGDAVTFIAQGGSFSLETKRGMETCYGHSFPHTVSGPVSYLDPSKQTLKQLTSEPWDQGGPPSQAPFTIAGTASPFRVATSGRLTFIYKTVGAGATVCDEGVINLTKPRLYRFIVHGAGVREGQTPATRGKKIGRKRLPNERELSEQEWGKLITSGTTGLAISISKLDASMCKVISDLPLDPGEYALEVGDLLFTFGIDVSDK